MTLKYNFICTDTCESIINNYLAYFRVVNLDSNTNKVQVKIALNAFTSKSCITDTLQELNIDFDSTSMIVSLTKGNLDKNLLTTYKLFCHDFLSLYISKYHSSFSQNELPMLISLNTKRILKFSIFNVLKDFSFYMNTLKIFDSFKFLSFKHLNQEN